MEVNLNVDSYLEFLILINRIDMSYEKLNFNDFNSALECVKMDHIT